MKHLKIVVVLLSSFFLISFTDENQNKLKTGFYFLAEKENEGQLIKDEDSEETFAVEKNEILTIDDFNDIKFVARKYLPNSMKVIELRLTKNGRKKWTTIQNRMSKTGESILFICNDKVYLEKKIIGKSNLSNSTIDLFVELKYQEAIFNTIKSEISNAK